MKLRWIAGVTLAVAVTAGPAIAQYGPPQGPPPPGYERQGGWDAPPAEFQRDIERRGFHDGIEGARKDYGNHRRPDVNNRDEYRKPNFIPPPDRGLYRDAFRHGYWVGVQHIYGQGYGPPTDWDRDHDRDRGRPY